MATQGDLISFRPDVRVLDATLRDGGLVNNFRFTDEFVRDLYKANVKANVDYMEFGYKASKEIFNPDDFGKWKFCCDDDVFKIVGDNNTDLKLSCMLDVGRTDFKNDVLEKQNSPFDLMRIATYIHQIPSAIEMIEDSKKKGYETSVNIMAISKVNDEELMKGLELLAKSPVDIIYIVDSFGAYYPEQIERLSEKYLELGNKYGKQIGIHAHNNQQLAFANTITALRYGVSWLDCTVSGMGRGAGNCYSESLLAFLKNPKYNLVPIMDFVAKHMQAVKSEGNKWGYDIPYLLTAILNSHPSSAIKFIKDNRDDYTNFLHELMDLE